MTMTSELKPCPFCNGEPSTVSTRAAGLHWWHVECGFDECTAHGPERGSREEAERQWNDRALPVTDERENDAAIDVQNWSAAPVEGDEAWADAVEEYRIRGNGISRAYALAAVKAIVAKAPDAGLVEALKNALKQARADLEDARCGILTRTGFKVAIGDIDAALARYQQQEG